MPPYNQVFRPHIHAATICVARDILQYRDPIHNQTVARGRQHPAASPDRSIVKENNRESVALPERAEVRVIRVVRTAARVATKADDGGAAVPAMAVSYLYVRLWGVP